MTESKICTCPSGDGSLRWPCPAHPAVEQAGGDERAAFELFVRKHCGMPEHIAVNWDAKFTNDAWEGWQARAALAQRSEFHQHLKECADEVATWPSYKREALTQPSPAQAEQEGGDERAAVRRLSEEAESTVIGMVEYCLNARVCLGMDEGFKSFAPEEEHDFVKELREFVEGRAALAQPSPVPELERPATFSVPSCENSYGFGYVDGTCIQSLRGYRDHLETIVDALPEGELMTVAQHNRILDTRWNRAMDLMGEHVSRISEKFKAERGAALARVAEMERQEPVAAVSAETFSYDGTSDIITRNLPIGTKLYAAPVAQAQQLHDLDKQCRDYVARALGLRPNQERGFAWSYLLASIKSCVKASEDSAQAQHSAGYAEARQCVNCRHIGINDAADYAACHDCRWTGPEPDEDKCPGCGSENCMAAACPECGGRYELVAETDISAPPAQAQHSVPEGWKPVPIEPLLNMMSDKDHDTRITAERQLLSILAAAPGKEGV
ncbi:TPA: hypothetical protein M5N95_004652 [Pseudomonas aeruginosa]|nr:hypothetical protein [Pseudomonas aeruginosa]